MPCDTACPAVASARDGLSSSVRRLVCAKPPRSLLRHARHAQVFIDCDEHPAPKPGSSTQAVARVVLAVAAGIGMTLVMLSSKTLRCSAPTDSAVRRRTARARRNARRRTLCSGGSGFLSAGLVCVGLFSDAPDAGQADGLADRSMGGM